MKLQELKNAYAIYKRRTKPQNINPSVSFMTALHEFNKSSTAGNTGNQNILPAWAIRENSILRG